MTEPHPPDVAADSADSAAPANDPFAPSWTRALLAVAIALAAFFVPQEVPLEYYPLNEPGEDILYLEISFAADFTGNTFIHYDAGKGFNELHRIQIPISPTERTYTYTFPLLDAPIYALRIDPSDQHGSIRIRQMRIIDRRGIEERRFTKDHMMPARGIESVTPLPEGWKISTAADISDPYLRVRLDTPIVAKGINARSVKRVLLSWSYLALMLWIILLAVYFALVRHRDLRTMGKSVAFLALLALVFSAVGNRGLIKNSIRYAQFVAPEVEPGFRLEFDLATDRPVSSQLYWDTGSGIRGEDSLRREYDRQTGMQTLGFELPTGVAFKELRWDPVDDAGTFRIHGVRVIDRGGRTRLKLEDDFLQPIQQIAELGRNDDGLLVVRTTEDATDPIVIFTPEALEAINALMGAPPEPAGTEP